MTGHAAVTTVIVMELMGLIVQDITTKNSNILVTSRAPTLTIEDLDLYTAPRPLRAFQKGPPDSSSLMKNQSIRAS